MKSFHEYCEFVAASQQDMPLHLVSNDEEFWKKFAQIANSVPHDLASFLDVPHESVSRWSSVINQAIKLSQAKKAEEEKNDMLSTGKR